ncbi:hypothetical protein ACFVKB_17435 [Rhodococcus sp. NPDC127530]
MAAAYDNSVLSVTTSPNASSTARSRAAQATPAVSG